MLARSFERIHRSNLIGMGVLPLRLPPERSPRHLDLRPGDVVEIEAPEERIQPRGRITVRIKRQFGGGEIFETTAAIETSLEVDILRSGGIIPRILGQAHGAWIG